MKLLPALLSACVLLSACNDQKENTTTPEPATATATPSPVPAASPSAPELPELPKHVIYKNWEIGNPAYVKMISDAYASWDTENAQDLASFFADSVIFDFPDSKRIIARPSIKDQLKKWRSAYAETSNIPFSIMSVHNKDENQDWVIAWTWNKWKYKDGVKDSMLYSDNWRIIDGKIAQMVSLEQKPNKQLAKALNKRLN